MTSSDDSADAANDEMIILDDPLSRSARKVFGLLDTPAYLRRAQRLESTLERLLTQCERRREELLASVRLRLRQWNRRVAEEPAAMTKRSLECRDQLASVNASLFAPGDRTTSHGPAAPAEVAWRDLLASLARFNRRWASHVERIDTREANKQIDDYNRHYLFEKECALRSASLAARGYRPIEPVTTEWILTRLPLLPSLE